MFDTLPATSEAFSQWSWSQIAPYYDDLLARELTAETVDQWLADWTRVSSLVDETSTAFTIKTTVNTTDTETEERYNRFLDEILPPYTEAEQRVKEKLVASGLEPAGFAVPLRKLRADIALYNDANVQVLSDLRKTVNEYEKIVGARTVEWEGQEVPLPYLAQPLRNPDRALRERAWRAYVGRIMRDGEALAGVWRALVTQRAQLARNSGLANYREYRWRQLYRFDYTPEDAKRFDDAIEQVVVPAAQRIHEQRRQRLGVETLRPWDMDVDPNNLPPLKPYETIEELESKTSAAFRHVSPRFQGYFETMRAEKLLDLEARKNKAAGGYSLAYTVTRRPFIFTNASGTHSDVETLLHEGGHAFHSFEMASLPYLQQRQEQMMPMEFAEVASMGMELLAFPFLTREYGSFYTPEEHARAYADHLRDLITFWPYMAMIDALQHWVYEHEDQSVDIEAVDAHWEMLADRFWPHLDWSGLEREKRAFWRRQGHPYSDPLYYIEYGVAQLGAIQVWARARRDRASAVEAYRHALSLGNTKTLPELFATAGARFSLTAETLKEAVDLVETVLAELEG